MTDQAPNHADTKIKDQRIPAKTGGFPLADETCFFPSRDDVQKAKSGQPLADGALFDAFGFIRSPR